MKKSFIFVSLMSVVCGLVLSSCTSEKKQETFFPKEWGAPIAVKQMPAEDNSKVVYDIETLKKVFDIDKISNERDCELLTDWYINVSDGFFPPEWGHLKTYLCVSDHEIKLSFDNKSIKVYDIQWFVKKKRDAEIDKKLADPTTSAQDKVWLRCEKKTDPWPILVEAKGKIFCTSCLEEEDYFYFTRENGIGGFYRINHDGTATAENIAL